MFQMIVAVIAVALVAIIAIAMIFFGGNVFTSGSDRALYAQLMNHGSQIEGALKLYQSDNGVYPPGSSNQVLAALIENDSRGMNYLKSKPMGDWFVEAGTIYRSLDDIAQCRRVNVTAKMDVENETSFGGCPPCTDESFKAWPGCRRETIQGDATP